MTARVCTCIVSGGQTGADRGGLLGAEDAGVATAGWAPPGFRCDDNLDGAVFETRFGVHALPDAQVDAALGKYRSRDRANVDMSDAVLAFLLHRPQTGRGTMQTVNYAVRGGPFGDASEPVCTNKARRIDVVLGTGARKRVACIVYDVHDMDAATRASVAAVVRRELEQSGSVRNLLVCGTTEKTQQGTEAAVRRFVRELLRP